jgi:hypothetical protein
MWLRPVEDDQFAYIKIVVSHEIGRGGIVA